MNTNNTAFDNFFLLFEKLAVEHGFEPVGRDDAEHIWNAASIEMFDRFWREIAAHYRVPSGSYTPETLVHALARAVRKETTTETKLRREI